MNILAIDHSTVSNHAWWPALVSSSNCETVRVALSVWNLVEIGFASDKKQQVERLEFLESLNPLWFRERVEIQKLELNSFVARRRFGVDLGATQAVTPHLSSVDHYFAGHQTRIGLTPAQFIAETDFEILKREKHKVPSALRTLQSADKSKLREVERQMFEAWMAGLLPNVNPAGRPISAGDRNDLLAFCWENRAGLFTECPAVAAEDALSAARTADPNRNPTESDGIDLHHAVVGLSYGTIFATADGYQGQCAQAARRRLGAGFAAVVREPSSLVDAVGAL